LLGVVGGEEPGAFFLSHLTMAAEAAKLMVRVGQLAAGAGIIAYAGPECLYNVDAGERVVVWNRFGGVQDDVKGEGTHFRIPYIDYPNFFDIKSKPRIINTTTGTKDMQQVNIALRVLSRPSEEKLPYIFKEIGPDYDERVLPSIGNEVLKAVVAQYNADQLLTMREKVSRAVSENLNLRAEQFHLILDDVSITHLTFGKEFTQAIEHKQVAQQDAERSKFLVEKAEQEKQVHIIQAEGESEAAMLISEAIKQNGSGLIEVRRIDAAKDIASTLSKSRNVAYLPSGGNMLLNLGVGGAA